MNLRENIDHLLKEDFTDSIQEFLQWGHDLTMDGYGWDPNINMYPMKFFLNDWMDEEEDTSFIAEETLKSLLLNKEYHVKTPWGLSEATLEWESLSPDIKQQLKTSGFNDDAYFNIIFNIPPNFNQKNMDNHYINASDNMTGNILDI